MPKFLVDAFHLILSAGFTALVAAFVSFFVAERRVAREFKLQFKAEAVLRRLLKDKRWTLRTFNRLSYHVAGFEDDELRKLLVQSGAVRFTDGQGNEVWGLVERNKDLLGAQMPAADSCNWIGA